MIHDLVLVEWEDSAQPTSSWMYLNNVPALEIIQCVSVGWIIDATDSVLMLSPNIGDYESGEGAQGTGFIRIPKRSITRQVKLHEVISSCGPSSHPGSKQMLQAS